MRALRPVRTFAHLVNGYPFDSEDFSDSASMPLVRIRDLNSETFETFIDPHLVPDRVVLKDGHVAIGMDGDFHARLWNRGKAALNQRVCALVANPSSDPRFLAYALPKPLLEINALTYSTTVKHLSSKQVLAIGLPDWTFEEQRAIADFLDRETAQIDAMIDAQADVVRLAQEHRGAVVAEEMTVVSAGGAPAVPLRYCLTVQSGVTLGKQFGDDAIEYPYLRVANVQAGYLNLDEIKTIRVSADVAASSTLRAGDVLITEGGDRAALGRGALWRGEIPNALHQNHIFALRCEGLLDPEFLVYVLDAPPARIYFESTRRQTTNLSSTNSGKVKAFKTPLPPIMKQREIVARLNEALVRVDEVIASAQRVIELLRERREALITAAVTGRIDPDTGIERTDPTTAKEAS